jgi:glycosyltransferase involved in cell wall biosynthesis
MRALHLISSGGNYGAENMLLSLCTGLRRSGCDTVIGVFLNSHRPHIDTTWHAKRLGLECVTFDCNGRVDLGTVRAIRNYVINNGMDLIHSHGYKADIYGYAAVRGKSIASVATCHSWPDRLRRSSLSLKLYGVLDKAVLKHFGIVAAVSEPLADLLARHGIHSSSIRSIPNGVDVELFANALPTFGEEIGKGKRIVVGMVSRLASGKGADFLLQAAQMLLKEYPDVVFAFIGDGPERKRLMGLAQELKIETSCIFAGQRHDMPQVYASLDVLVLPSFSEGMPMAILEAMAASKPVVATDVGAIPSVVIPEKTGILVKPGNAEGLQAAIKRFLLDPSLGITLGRNAHKLVLDKYSVNRMTSSYLDAYRQALSKGSANQVSMGKKKHEHRVW